MLGKELGFFWWNVGIAIWKKMNLGEKETEKDFNFSPFLWQSSGRVWIILSSNKYHEDDNTTGTITIVLAPLYTFL